MPNYLQKIAATATEDIKVAREALRKKRGEYDALRKRIERTRENQISLIDPDSRAMATHTKVGVGYNVQIAVDAKHKMIVEQAVSNDVLDTGTHIVRAAYFW